MGVKEEGKPWAEGVHIQTYIQGGLDIGDPIGQSEGHFLNRCGTRFPDMITADANGIPLRNLFCTKGKDIGNDPHGGLGRKDIGPSGRVLLQDVVLYRAPQFFGGNALLFCNCHVHGQQDGRRGIDRHGCTHLIQGDAVE